MNTVMRCGHRLLSSGAPAAGCAAVFCRYSATAAGKRAIDAGGDFVMIDQRRLPADYDPASFDPTADHRSPPSDRVWHLIDEISALSLAEVAELSLILMRKLGMKEAPTIGVTKAGAGGSGAAYTGGTAAAEAVEAKAEKTAFELRLDSYDAAAKIKVIKEVRGVTDLGLKEAKELVEKTPAVFKRGVTKEEAEKIIEKLKAVGAKVVME